MQEENDSVKKDSSKEHERNKSPVNLYRQQSIHIDTEYCLSPSIYQVSYIYFPSKWLDCVFNYLQEDSSITPS